MVNRQKNFDICSAVFWYTDETIFIYLQDRAFGINGTIQFYFATFRQIGSNHAKY